MEKTQYKSMTEKSYKNLRYGKLKYRLLLIALPAGILALLFVAIAILQSAANTGTPEDVTFAVPLLFIPYLIIQIYLILYQGGVPCTVTITDSQCIVQIERHSWFYTENVYIPLTAITSVRHRRGKGERLIISTDTKHKNIIIDSGSITVFKRNESFDALCTHLLSQPQKN